MAARETDQFWDIIEKVGVAMLTTRFPGGLRAVPVEARPERNAGIICFLTDLRILDVLLVAIGELASVWPDAGIRPGADAPPLI
jgi:hypothetical protein